MTNKVMLTVMLAVALVIPFVVSARTEAGKDGSKKKHFEARLSGFQEAPSVSTGAGGRFRAMVNAHDDELRYRLSYSELEGNVLQAHIHLGQKSVNGGIMAFLCSNLGNGPAGTQPCPPGPATIDGVITADSIRLITAQGIALGEFDEFLRALRAGSGYVNVHSSLFPGGEIRGQIR